MKGRMRGRSKPASPGTGGKRTASGPKLFGSSIDDTREGIPRVLMIAQAFFESYGVQTEGLFRISPEKPVLDELVQKFDDGSPVDISSYADSGHTMAGLLKRYFREMPEPLIPYDLYEAFVTAVTGQVEPEMKALRLQKIVTLLSPPRLATLRALIEILCLVASERPRNKMGPDNLAVVFAPTLFRPPSQNLEQQMRDTPKTTECVLLFIEHFDRIFPPDEKAKKKSRPTPAVAKVELFVPERAEMPSLPELPPLPAVPPQTGAKLRPKRGSVTLDNAQLAAFSAKRDPALHALVGKQVSALYQGDQMWYPAVVESVDPSGMAIVVFTDYGNRQVCTKHQITTGAPPSTSSPQPPRPNNTIGPSGMAGGGSGGGPRKSDRPPVAPPRSPGRSLTMNRMAASKSSSMVNNQDSVVARSSPSIPALRPLTPPPQQGVPRPASPRELSPRGQNRAVTVSNSGPSPREGIGGPPKSNSAPTSPHVAPRPPKRPSAGTTGLSVTALPARSSPVGVRRAVPPVRPEEIKTLPSLPPSQPQSVIEEDDDQKDNSRDSAASHSSNYDREEAESMAALLAPDANGDVQTEEEPDKEDDVVTSGQHFLEDVPEMDTPPTTVELGAMVRPKPADVSMTVLVNANEPPPAYAEFGSDDDDEGDLAPPPAYAASPDEDDYTDTLDLPPLPPKTPQVLSAMADIVSEKIE